jgi:ribosome assembly protein YihI (activator of Der GTPase)
LAREKWKVDRGYSSGASSYGSDEDETSDHHHKQDKNTGSENGPKVIVELPFDPKKIPHPKKSLHRNTSEVSCLSELKETIEKDGDLAKTIVRIEVCQHSASFFVTMLF